MKRLLLLFIGVVISLMCEAQKVVDFKYFNVTLPDDCEMNHELMSGDLRNIAYSNKDNSFIFHVCFFEMEEDFDIRERLQEESECDLNETGYAFVTVGEGEDPLLLVTDGIFCTAIFADYINNVGICIFIHDIRNVDIEDKMSVITSFRRPQVRKLDNSFWMGAVNDMRNESQFGNLSTDMNNGLNTYDINGYKLDMPKAMKKKEKESGSIEYSNEDRSLIVLFIEDSLNTTDSAGNILYDILNMYKVNLFHVGMASCFREDCPTYIFYSGTVVNTNQLATAILYDEEAGKNIYLTVIGQEQKPSTIWSIIRSLHR